MDKKARADLLAQLKFSIDLWKKSEALKRRSEQLRNFSHNVMRSVKELRSTIKKPPQMLVVFLTHAFSLN
jgi:hypothetical protein